MFSKSDEECGWIHLLQWIPWNYGGGIAFEHVKTRLAIRAPEPKVKTYRRAHSVFTFPLCVDAN
jgi:hypothetical protein